MDTKTEAFFHYLGRGGTYQYLARFQPRYRVWTCQSGEMPDCREDENIYYSVHPVRVTPTGKTRGTVEEVEAINCLYADFDCQDKTAPPGELAEVLMVVQALNPKPTAVVATGGGFHCYWLLDYPYPLDSNEARERVIALQKGWVQQVGADPKACDLARVLRLPGSKNVKLDRDGGAPRAVTWHALNWSRTYTLDALEQSHHAWRATQRPAPTVAHQPTPTARQPLQVAHHAPGEATERRKRAYGLTALANEVERVRTATTYRNNQLNDSRWTLQTKVEAGMLTREEVDAALEAAALAAGLEPKEIRDTLRSGGKKSRAPAVLPVVHPRGNGKVSNVAHGALQVEAKPVDDPADAPQETRNLTDLGNAGRLVDAYGESLRYVHAWGSWFLYNGGRWRRDETQQVDRLAQQVVVSLYATAQGLKRRAEITLKGIDPLDDAPQAVEQREIGKAWQGQADALQKWARQSESAGKLRAMVELARADARVATRHDAFDTNPWSFCAANGIVNLRTGELEEHHPDRLHRLGSDVLYQEGATCPRWEAFIDWITCGDRALADYLQRIVGYTMTGLITEQVFFFLYGEGGNGKSTFINLIGRLLGDYFGKAPIDMILVQHNPPIPSDLARLPGKRMAVPGEMKKGKRLDEGRVKDMTGGDPMSVRFLHQEFFDFRPQFKLWVYGQYKPAIHGEDYGIVRRLRLIPFRATVDETMKDPDLEERLAEELPGILQWAIDGCLNWQAHGLGMPESVRQATGEYVAEMDPVKAFIGEACITGSGNFEASRKLHRAYQKWCEETGEHAIREREFCKQLDRLGHPVTRGGASNFRRGIRLKTAEEVEQERLEARLHAEQA